MNRISLYIILLLFLNSCSPIIKTHGYTIENPDNFTQFLSEMSEENDEISKNHVKDIMGSPSVSILDIDNIWIYMLTSKEDKSFSDSELVSQFIVRFQFNSNDELISTSILLDDDFNQISFSKEKTQSAENQYGITDQIIDAFTRGN